MTVSTGSVVDSIKYNPLVLRQFCNDSLNGIVEVRINNYFQLSKNEILVT